MADKNNELYIPNSQIVGLVAIRPVDDSRFTAAMSAVVQESEAMRMRYMKAHQRRGFLAMTLGILLALGGAGGFGWFFLVKFDLKTGLICMIPALIVPLLMNWWTTAPVKKYVRDYKTKFMPRMAEALGGFRYNPRSGISRDIVGKTGVAPGHDQYHAEDCFIGLHNGVKVMFSEARLYSRKNPVFHGLFVLMETPHKIFEGHTIITSDKALVERSAGKRWAKLLPVKVTATNPDWDRFQVFSDKPEDASLLVGEKLLKELSEAADIFDKAEITAVLFRSKYIFLMIPHQGDMFEPSTMFLPVSSMQNALKCKHEIERLREIIDVFEIYKARSGGPV